MTSGILPTSTKLRLRRVFRRTVKTAKISAQNVGEQFDTNFIGRFKRVRKIRRFVAGWLGLTILLTAATLLQTIALSSAYQTTQPVSGGTMHEGYVGSFSTANPLYATGAVNVAVAKLLFAGLLTYDENNQLTGDLAESYSLDELGKTYTVVLRKNLFWHDGKALTADDVVFTFQAMQNPEARSVHESSMRGVTIAKVDQRTVTFTLPSALSSFPESLTVGILPKHLLRSVPLSQLRDNSFNKTDPVGSGPFKWESLSSVASKTGDTSQYTINFSRFDDYYRGTPKIENFIIRTYETTPDLIRAFERREISSVAGIKSTPNNILDGKDVRLYSFQTTAALMSFFNMNNAILSDVGVRRGLLYATSRKEIIQKLDPSLRIVREPVLRGQFAFDPEYASSLYNVEKAKTTLDQAGWITGKDGVRAKDGKKLQFRLYAENTPDNKTITELLKKQWGAVGADVIITLQPSQFFQETLEYRNYDAVLYNISIGNDPDVFPYWHSSQAISGMNFSNYKSTVADTALEAGRTRQDQAQRALKYKPFLKAWSEDVPAISLFRPKIYYITRGDVYGLQEHVLNTDDDRYNNISDWMIHTANVDQR